MRLPKILFKSLVLLFLLRLTPVFSQSGSSVKKVRFSVDATFISNRTHSHYQDPRPKGDGIIDLSTRAQTRPFSQGCAFGVTFIFLARSTHNLILSASISQTQAEYVRRGYFVEKKKREYVTISSKFFYGNLEAGWRFNLGRFFSIQPSLVMHYSMVTEQTSKGTIERWPNGSIITVNVNETTRFHDKTRASTRLTLIEGFTIKNLRYSLFQFLNTGIGFRSDWLGMGASVAF